MMARSRCGLQAAMPLLLGGLLLLLQASLYGATFSSSSSSSRNDASTSLSFLHDAASRLPSASLSSSTPSSSFSSPSSSPSASSSPPTPLFSSTPEASPESAPAPTLHLVESSIVGDFDLLPVPSSVPTHEALVRVCDASRRSLDVVLVYANLLADADKSTFSEAELQEMGAWRGQEVFEALERAAARGVTLRLLLGTFPSSPPLEAPEIRRLIQNHPARVQHRVCDLAQWYGGGIVHQKMWIADGAHYYLGSANFDWKSLAQVKELGVLVLNDGLVSGKDLQSLFDVFWDFADPHFDFKGGKSINITDTVSTATLQVPSWDPIVPPQQKTPNPFEKEPYQRKSELVERRSSLGLDESLATHRSGEFVGNHNEEAAADASTLLEKTVVNTHHSVAAAQRPTLDTIWQEGVGGKTEVNADEEGTRHEDKDEEDDLSQALTLRRTSPFGSSKPSVKVSLSDLSFVPSLHEVRESVASAETRLGKNTPTDQSQASVLSPFSLSTLTKLSLPSSLFPFSPSSSSSPSPSSSASAVGAAATPASLAFSSSETLASSERSSTSPSTGDDTSVHQDGELPSEFAPRNDLVFSASSSSISHPLHTHFNSTSSLTFFSASPGAVLSWGRSGDLSGLLWSIARAQKFVCVSVMDFAAVSVYPGGHYPGPVFFPQLSDALVRAACERGVAVRLLVSRWRTTKKAVWRSLWALRENVRMCGTGKRQEQRKSESHSQDLGAGVARDQPAELHERASEMRESEEQESRWPDLQIRIFTVPGWNETAWPPRKSSSATNTTARAEVARDGGDSAAEGPSTGGFVPLSPLDAPSPSTPLSASHTSSSPVSALFRPHSPHSPPSSFSSPAPPSPPPPPSSPTLSDSPRWPSFSRVNHCKFLLTESVANVGTSNWEWGYFHQTGGVSMNTDDPALRAALGELFDRDWHSPYSQDLREAYKAIGDQED